MPNCRQTQYWAPELAHPVWVSPFKRLNCFTWSTKEQQAQESTLSYLLDGHTFCSFCSSFLFFFWVLVHSWQVGRRRCSNCSPGVKKIASGKNYMIGAMMGSHDGERWKMKQVAAASLCVLHVVLLRRIEPVVHHHTPLLFDLVDALGTKDTSLPQMTFAWRLNSRFYFELRQWIQPPFLLTVLLSSVRLAALLLSEWSSNTE